MHLHWARTELFLASSPAIFAAPDISMCQMEQFGANHPPVHTSVRSPPASFLPKHPPFSWLAYQPHQANPIQSLTALFPSNPSLLLHTPFSGRSCTTFPPPTSLPQCPSPAGPSRLLFAPLPAFPRCFAPFHAFPPCRGRCPSSPPWQDAGSAGPCCFQDSQPFPGNGYDCCGCDACYTLREL